jgi:hypothetical protein
VSRCTFLSSDVNLLSGLISFLPVVAAEAIGERTGI